MLKIKYGGEDRYVPAWFEDEKIGEMSFKQRQGYQDHEEPTIGRETGKALLLSFITDYGKVEYWVPKSILMDENERGEQLRKRRERMELNERYDAYLHETARDNNVKLGQIRKWDKIKGKLDDAGIEYMDRDEFARSLS